MSNETPEKNFLTVEELLEKRRGFFKLGSHLIKALAMAGTGQESLDFFRARLAEVYAETGRDCEASKLIKIVENHVHCPVERWEGPIMRAKRLAGVEFDLPASHIANMVHKPREGSNIEDLIMNKSGDDFDDDLDDNEPNDIKPKNADPTGKTKTETETGE